MTDEWRVAGVLYFTFLYKPSTRCGKSRRDSVFRSQTLIVSVPWHDQCVYGTTRL
jgi:hypothetical protein